MRREDRADSHDIELRDLGVAIWTSKEDKLFTVPADTFGQENIFRNRSDFSSNGCCDNHFAAGESIAAYLQAIDKPESAQALNYSSELLLKRYAKVKIIAITPVVRCPARTGSCPSTPCAASSRMRSAVKPEILG